MDHGRAVHGLWSEFVCSFKSMSFIKEKEQENAEGIAKEVSIVRPCWSHGDVRLSALSSLSPTGWRRPSHQTLSLMCL